MTPEIAAILERLPTNPGVYLMRGHGREIVYVGKATNLRSRVRSYFSGNDPRAFVAHLDRILTDIETIITANPKEALLLENTLIKKHKPRFNIMLRDDKNYLSIRIDRTHEWPRVDLVRKIRNDGASYFGPYHSASKVRQTLHVLNRHFHLRTCRDAVLRNRRRPCLQYQIRRCPGPCVLPVDRDIYMESVEAACLFLTGREKELREQVEQRMLQAAEDLRFEDAARLRDQLQAIDDSLVEQHAVQTTQRDQDVLGIYREAERVAVTVMQYRSGALHDVRSFAFDGQLVPDDTMLASFVSQFYTLDALDLPEELLAPVALAEQDAIADALAELRGRKVKITVPKRGDKTRLLALANDNAQAHFDETLSSHAQAETALSKLQDRLRLAQMPRTMECYDISNFQGTHIVASQVAFHDAVPDRARYRRLKIRTAHAQDDFLSMFEVIARRVKRAKAGGEPLPDLIVIDGGKGQLNAALQAMREGGVEDPVVIGLAKSRVVGTTKGDTSVRSFERVFLPGRKDPIEMPPHAEDTYLLERIRDEAHKTAITYHRDLRRKATLKSGLDDIPGIGKTRRTALLNHFGSLKKVRAATLTALEQAPGMSRMAAYAVFDHFHPGEADPPDPS